MVTDIQSVLFDDCYIIAITIGLLRYQVDNICLLQDTNNIVNVYSESLMVW